MATALERGSCVSPDERGTCPAVRFQVQNMSEMRSIFGMPVYGDLYTVHGSLCTHTRSVARDPHPGPGAWPPANCMSAQYGLRCLVMGSSVLAGAGPTARTVRLPGSISVCLFTARSVSRDADHALHALTVRCTQRRG